MTKRLRPLAAIATAFPLAIIARSTTFPLTINALELGKSFLILGGRPISRVFETSAEDIVFLAMAFSPFYGLGFKSFLNPISLLLGSGQYLPLISFNLRRGLFAGDVSPVEYQESVFPPHLQLPR